MKSLFFAVSFSFCSVLVPVPLLHAQERPFDPLGAEAEQAMPRQIRIQVEYIDISLGKMSELMADPVVAKNDAALRKKLDELIDKGTAKIVETQVIVARSGQKATAESIEEFIYPTEYEPPTLPCGGGDDVKIPSEYRIAGPVPTAFETRNLGATLEVEPTLGDSNKIIDVRLAPEIVYLVENFTWTTWKDEHGEANILMPVFYTLRFNTAVTVQDGRPCFVAALSPKNDKGEMDSSRKLMVFLKCNVMVAGD